MTSAQVFTNGVQLGSPQPPTVYQGLVATYRGTMSGPWAAPVPVEMTLIRFGSTVKAVVNAVFTDVVTNAVSSVVFSPAFPPEFWPPSDAVGALFVYLSPSPLTVPYFSMLAVVSAAGILDLESFAGPFTPGNVTGLAPCATLSWPSR